MKHSSTPLLQRPGTRIVGMCRVFSHRLDCMTVLSSHRSHALLCVFVYEGLSNACDVSHFNIIPFTFSSSHSDYWLDLGRLYNDLIAQRKNFLLCQHRESNPGLFNNSPVRSPLSHSVVTTMISYKALYWVGSAFRHFFKQKVTSNFR